MRITFELFAKKKRVAIEQLQRAAAANRWRFVECDGVTYMLHPETVNGKTIYMIEDNGTLLHYHHLSNEERAHAIAMLNELTAQKADQLIERVAKAFSTSYHTIYRLNRERSIERKKRCDAGCTRKGVPPEAMSKFEAYYISNNQANAKLAYNLVRRQFQGFDLPYRYFVKKSREIEPARLRYHQEAGFERLHGPRIRRDLWTEFEFMEEVSLDGWVVPDRCLKSVNLPGKFNYNGRDVSMVCIFAFDTRTGYPLAWKAFERSINQEDVLSLLLEIVYRWGRPSGHWLMDNGSEFINEAVQRFVRGLWNTEEHETKQRVVFSLPYGPNGKGRHERQHKIFKDEFSAFSRSYSPNARESRKPTKQLSYVKPTHTLAEWKEMFTAYLNGYYMEAERISWQDPNFKRYHERNANRPHTLTEAIDRAYTTFVKQEVEPQKLAFLYASKFTAHIKQSTFRTTHAGEIFVYVPEGDGVPMNRYHELFEVVVNPLELGQAWVCDMQGNMVCEAWDLRYKNNGITFSRERAAAARKLRNRINKLAKEEAEAKVAFDDVTAQLASRHRTAGVSGGTGVSARHLTEPIESHNIEQALFSDPQFSPDVAPASLPVLEDEEYIEIGMDIYDQERKSA